MPVEERIQDLLAVRSKKDLVRVISRTFEYINEVEKRKKQNKKDNTPLESFNPDNRADIWRYLTGYLPRRMGRNYAKIHDLGLVHRYAHTGNITLTGDPCDLDSMKGPALKLDDPPNTRGDRFYDLTQLLETTEVLDKLQKRGLIKGSSKASAMFKMSFFASYHKYGKNKIDEAQLYLKKGLGETELDGLLDNRGELGYLWNLLVDAIELNNYKYSPRLEEMFPRFWVAERELIKDMLSDWMTTNKREKMSEGEFNTFFGSPRDDSIGFYHPDVTKRFAYILGKVVGQDIFSTYSSNINDLCLTEKEQAVCLIAIGRYAERIADRLVEQTMTQGERNILLQNAQEMLMRVKKGWVYST